MSAARSSARSATGSASPGPTPDMRRMVPLMIVHDRDRRRRSSRSSRRWRPNVFDGDERATSLLVAAQGVGAVIGAFTLGWSTAEWGLWRVMVTAIDRDVASALVVYGAAPSLWVAAIGLAGCGFGYGSRSPRSPASPSGGERRDARSACWRSTRSSSARCTRRRAGAGSAGRPVGLPLGDRRVGCRAAASPWPCCWSRSGGAHRHPRGPPSELGRPSRRHSIDPER